MGGSLHANSGTYAFVSLFPSLRDPFSTKGYEHLYDPEKGTGYISWHLKTLLRKNPKQRCLLRESGGPSRRRMTDVGQQLEGDACREAISFLVHAADEAEVMQKMKQTFKHRQELVHNPERSADVLNIFPRFPDVKRIDKSGLNQLCCSILKHPTSCLRGGRLHLSRR